MSDLSIKNTVVTSNSVKHALNDGNASEILFNGNTNNGPSISLTATGNTGTVSLTVGNIVQACSSLLVLNNGMVAAAGASGTLSFGSDTTGTADTLITLLGLSAENPAVKLNFYQGFTSTGAATGLAVRAPIVLGPVGGTYVQVPTANATLFSSTSNSTTGVATKGVKSVVAEYVDATHVSLSVV